MILQALSIWDHPRIRWFPRLGSIASPRHRWNSHRTGGDEVSTTVVWVVVSNIFYFHPYQGKIPILTFIFSDGLKPPTSCIAPYKTALEIGNHRQALKKKLFIFMKLYITPVVTWLDATVFYGKEIAGGPLLM